MKAMTVVNFNEYNLMNINPREVLLNYKKHETSIFISVRSLMMD